MADSQGTVRARAHELNACTPWGAARSRSRWAIRGPCWPSPWSASPTRRRASTTATATSPSCSTRSSAASWRRRAADRVSHHLAGRGVPEPHQPQVPQPDVDGHRGDDPRPADGRGRADGRLRQDRAGPADGRGLRRAPAIMLVAGPMMTGPPSTASGSAPAPIAAGSGRAIAPASG